MERRKENIQIEPYDAISLIYDRWQYSFHRPFHELVCESLCEEIRRYRLSRGCFLDLACGTGDVANFMAHEGWEVWGVDSSRAMLQMAEKKRNCHQGRLVYLQQRIENLSLNRLFDLAGCFYDSINHILQKRTLQRALVRIRRHLTQNGLFIFDTNTLRCYEDLWNTTSVGHEDEFTVIIENTFTQRSRRAVSKVTIFKRTDSGLYEKMKVQVAERWYSEAEIESMLRKAGFSVLRRDPMYLFVNREPDPYKQWWVCKAV